MSVIKDNVEGIRMESIKVIDERIQFFRERNRPFQFEITPANASAELLGYSFISVVMTRHARNVVSSSARLPMHPPVRTTWSERG